MEDQIVGRILAAAAKGAPVSIAGEELYIWISESLSCHMSCTELLSDSDSAVCISDTSSGGAIEIVVGESIKKELMDAVNI